MDANAWWTMTACAAGGALAAVAVGLAMQTDAGRALLVAWGMRLAAAMLGKIESWLVGMYVRSTPGPTRTAPATDPIHDSPSRVTFPVSARLRDQIQNVRGARKLLATAAPVRAGGDR